MKWNYGDAFKRFPVGPEAIEFEDGSVLQAHDIFNELPDFMKKADVIFTDAPWNLRNIKSFYTKAEIEFPAIFDFLEFTDRLFECIKEVNPRVCYLEIGKEYLADYIMRMKQLYKCVTFYNTTYYHKKENLCYIVQGSNKRKNWHYDWMDEEDVIYKIAENENCDCIGDFCMGRGLVALAATKNGKRFVGTELNPKRLAVTLERLYEIGKRA